jgi:kinesin family protein 1
MIAAISPADYDETMSTLRYADQAKKIKTKAVVNMDPTTKAIGSLKDEIESLRKALMVYAPDEVERIKTNIHGEKKKLARPVRSKSTVVLTEPTGDKVAVELTKEEMESRLKSTENILADINQTWEDKLEKAEKIITEREQMLKSLGISIEKDEISVHMPRDLPCLVSLNEDPLMTECLVYQLKQGMTHVDRLDGQLQRDDHIHTIQLSGIHIQDNHCYFDNIDHTVTLHPTENGTVIVNGISITEPKVLHNGYRITLGDSHVFRFNNPQEKLREIQMQKTDVHADTMTDDETSQLESWNQMRGSSPIHYSIFDKLTDDDIDRLLDDVSKIRFMRKRETSTPDSFYRRRPLSHARTISSICTDDFDQGYYSTDVSTLPSPTCTNYSQHLFLNSSEKHPRPLSIQIPNTLSPSQVVLGKKVVEHWRAKHGASLAQTILYYCDYINHANKKSDIEYRFCIIHDDDHLLRSHWDTNTVDPSLADKKKPCVAIQKIDKKNRSTSTWSIEHFLSQQNESKAAPCYVQVGLAKVPLKSLGSQIPFEMDASLICQTTGQKRGTIKMLLATIARSINRAHKDDSKGLLCVGQQLIFEIRMMEINGVDSEYFSHIHSQFRLSMFGSDGVVTTELLPTNSTVTFNHSQSVSLTVTDEILDALENKHITFEVHGRPTAKYFDQFQQHVSAPSPPLSPVPLETKRVQGILSSIHILELTPLGEYDHVPVQLNKKSIEDGVFSLQQGQQRRIMLSIEHLDKSIFEKVLQMKVGHPRLVDQHGKVLDSSETHIPITLSSSTQLCAQGSWDSSLYGVSFMNRVTPLTQHILLTLTWILQAKDDEPMTFTKEISIRIKDQNEAVKTKKLKRSSSLLRFFSTNAIRQHVTGIFNIEYHGKLMGFSHLWRRYEPCASVLNAYYNARKAIECKEQVERTRHRLGLIKMPIVKSNANPQFVLDLWMDDKHKVNEEKGNFQVENDIEYSILD